jgi:hypothetical protein
MIMQKRLLIIIMISVQALLLQAQNASESHIVKVASAFVQGYLGDNEHTVATVSYLNIGDRSDICLIGLTPEGWLLMSSDYSVLPVLAFSLTGSFTAPPADINDNRFVFLSGYAEQLKAVSMEKSTFSDPRWDPSFYFQKSSQTMTAEETVTPFIKANWNQGSGWNRFCPADEEGPGGHVYAGCVAVSMGQAMSVFGTPSKGKGSNQYTHPVYGSIYVDFSKANYNWDAMSLSFPDDNNAMLLYHCAVGVNMDFSPDGSGTLTSAAASTALKEFFFYSQKMAFTRRGTDTQLWKSKLDSSLLAGNPVIYSGFPITGSVGHAFNVDGVFKSNYYHVNWGWGGVDNGYYTIDAFKPGSSDFTKDQTAIFRIQPYYYPTGMELSDTLVLLSLPAGEAIGKFSVIDEAVDNIYNIKLECDSAFTGTEWIMDYYLDGDSLRAGRTFARLDGPVDTITFIISDAHGNLVRSTRLLLLTASVSVPEPDTEDTFSIFPVPVNRYLVVTLPDGTERLTITAYNGKEVKNILPETDRLTIPAADLPPGLYVVSVYTGDGRRRSKSFVKN